MNRTVTAQTEALTPEDGEAYHLDAEAQVQVFSYTPPEPDGRPKQIARLVRRPFMLVSVQYVRDGGDNNLHFHTKSETTWFVLRGRALFYGPEGEVMADLGPNEGIHIPGGARYRFRKEGCEDLEIFQVMATKDPDAGPSERINVERHRAWMEAPHLQQY